MSDEKYEVASFAAGCFWGVEAAFRELDGVVSTTVGYMGGHTDDPTYNDVCTGTTGHAETVQVVFDPSKLSYEKLLETFWNKHDPTTINRQGPDIGEQYRSIIFYHKDKQKELAIKSKDELDASGRYSRPIVTEIIPAGKFYRAEEYHQQYLEKSGRKSCRF